MAKLVVACCCDYYCEVTPELLQREIPPHLPDRHHNMNCCRCYSCDTNCYLGGRAKCREIGKKKQHQVVPHCDQHRLSYVVECEGYNCQGCLVPELRCYKRL